MCTDHDAWQAEDQGDQQRDGKCRAVKVAQHKAGENHQHHAMIAREAVAGGVFGWDAGEFADPVDIVKSQGWAGVFDRQQVAKLVEHHYR